MTVSDALAELENALSLTPDDRYPPGHEVWAAFEMVRRNFLENPQLGDYEIEVAEVNRLLPFLVHAFANSIFRTLANAKLETQRLSVARESIHHNTKTLQRFFAFYPKEKK